MLQCHRRFCLGWACLQLPQHNDASFELYTLKYAHYCIMPHSTAIPLCRSLVLWTCNVLVLCLGFFLGFFFAGFLWLDSCDLFVLWLAVLVLSPWLPLHPFSFWPPPLEGAMDARQPRRSCTRLCVFTCPCA